MDLVSEFSKIFETFTENLKTIEKIKPQDWKTTLRSRLIEQFAQLQASFDTMRDSKLKSISTIFEDLTTDIEDHNKKHNDLVYGRDVALKQKQILDHLFDKNKFCAISKMQK